MNSDSSRPGSLPATLRDRVVKTLERLGIRKPAGPELYFLHIPKTSGTSVREFLVAACGATEVSPQVAWDHFLAGAVKPGVRVISGHLGGLLPIWLHRWPRIITMLRDPVARALSHINHVQRQPEHILHVTAQGLSVQQYCEHPALRKTVSNFQSRYLASLGFARALLSPEFTSSPFGTRSVEFENALYALDGAFTLREQALGAIDVIDAVGFCEAHAASLKLFEQALGLGLRADLREVRVNVAPSGWQLSKLSPTERMMLLDLNEIDSAVYAYARDKFVKTCRTRGIELDASWQSQHEGSCATAA